MNNLHDQSAFSKIVSDINNTILNSVTLTRQKGYVPLGPGFNNLNLSDASYNLQLHRFAKKFEVPSDSNASDRKKSTIASMIEYDSLGMVDFNPAILDLEPYQRLQLYRVRSRFHEIISRYNFDVSRLELPSGETFVSAGGDISLYAKLRSRVQWTITKDCLPLFGRIAYNSPMLKHAVNRHARIKAEELGITPNYSLQYRKLLSDGIKPQKAAYEIFFAKLLFIVTIVKDARITTVPKELAVDRVIECDAFCNMVTQRTIACCVRELIKEEFDIDLDESQVTHKLLIGSLDNVTIDLKNASNSVWLVVVKWLCGNSTLGKHLTASRCGTVLLPDSSRYVLNMLSPMGNGFTFEVMTLILLTVVREYDSFGHVFGDDIIVDRDVGQDVIDMLSILGFTTNTSKTFLNGSFRESCGGFTHNGVYLTSFDFEWADDIVEAISLVNKVSILSYDQHTTSLQKQKWIDLRDSLLNLIPAHLLRAVDFTGEYASRLLKDQTIAMHNLHRGEAFNKSTRYFGFESPVYGNPIPGLTSGVFATRKFVLQKQKQCNRCKTALEDFKMSELYIDFCVAASGKKSEPFHPALVFTKKSKTYRFAKGPNKGAPMKPIDNVNNLLAWTYVWAGRSQAPNLRDTTIYSEWVVHSTDLV